MLWLTLAQAAPSVGEHAAEEAPRAGASGPSCADSGPTVSPYEFVSLIGQHDFDEAARLLRELRGSPSELPIERRPHFEELLDVFVRIQRRHEDALRARCVRTSGQLARILLAGPLGEGLDDPMKEAIAHQARIRGLHQQTMVRLLNEGLDKVVSSLHVKDISPEELKSELARRETSAAPVVNKLHMTMARNFILQDLIEKGLYRIEDKEKQLEYLSRNIIPYLALRSNEELSSLANEIESREHASEIDTLLAWAARGVMKQRRIEGRERARTSAELLSIVDPGGGATPTPAPRGKVKSHVAGEHVVPAGTIHYGDMKGFMGSVKTNLRRYEKEKLRPLYENLHRIVDVRKDEHGVVHYARRAGPDADRARAELLRDWGSDLPWLMSAERATTLAKGRGNPWGTTVTSLASVIAVAVSEPGPDGTRVIHFPSNPEHDIVLPNDTDKGIVTALSGSEPASDPSRVAANDLPGASRYDVPYANDSFNNDRPSTMNGFNRGWVAQTAATDPPKGLFPASKRERDSERRRQSEERRPDVEPRRADSGAVPSIGRVGDDSHVAKAAGSDLPPELGGPVVAQNSRPGGGSYVPSQSAPLLSRRAPRALPFNSQPPADTVARPRRSLARAAAASADSFGEAAARAERANDREEGGAAPAVEAPVPPAPPALASAPPVFAPPPAPVEPSVGAARAGAGGDEAVSGAASPSEPTPPQPPPASFGPTTTSIDTTVATDEARRPVRTTTTVQETEIGTGKPVKKTVKETQLDAQSQRPTKVTETTTEYDPSSHKDKKITKVEMELDPASQRTTRVTETVRDFDGKTHEEVTVTKTVTEMEPVSGKPRTRVQTVKTLDPRTHHPTRVMVVTSQIDVASQRIIQRSTTTSEYEPVSQKLLSRTTRVQYGADLRKGGGSSAAVANGS